MGRSRLVSNAPVFSLSSRFPRSFPRSLTCSLARSLPRLKAVMAGFFWAALIVVMACGQPGSSLTGQESLQVSRHMEGMVVEVVARDIEEVETLQIRDSGGKIWTFTTEGHTGITPAHLREHQLFGDAVTVTYQEKDGSEGRVLVASVIADQ